nr:hypothetical protein [Tanacetum cinerariifolium]
MDTLATLTGQTDRVVHLPISLDGQTIIPGAGHGILRLWNVFPLCKSQMVSTNFENFKILPNKFEQFLSLQVTLSRQLTYCLTSGIVIVQSQVSLASDVVSLFVHQRERPIPAFGFLKST